MILKNLRCEPYKHVSHMLVYLHHVLSKSNRVMRLIQLYRRDKTGMLTYSPQKLLLVLRLTPQISIKEKQCLLSYHILLKSMGEGLATGWLFVKYELSFVYKCSAINCLKAISFALGVRKRN